MNGEEKIKKEMIVTAQNGSIIKLIFSESDNKNAVNTVLDNLMSSYEKRICGINVQ